MFYIIIFIRRTRQLNFNTTNTDEEKINYFSRIIHVWNEFIRTKIKWNYYNKEKQAY